MNSSIRSAVIAAVVEAPQRARRVVGSLRKPKQIGIFGYFGGRNLGDDLMLESLLPVLGDDVVLFARDASRVSSQTVAEYEVVTASVKAMLPRLPSLYRLVRCGGTIFHDEVGQPQARVAMNYSAQVALLGAAKLVGAKPALLGVGIGKVERRMTRLALLAALRISNPVVFRDERSLDRAKELGFDRGLLGVDLAFLDGDRLTEEESPVIDESKTSIVVCPVDLDRYDIAWHGANQVDGWVRLVAACSSDTEKRPKVRVVAFKDNERESDVPISKQIAKKLIDSGFEAEVVDQTNGRVAVEGAGVVIAARFHAGILAAQSRKPLVLVPYNRKIVSLGSDLGIPDAVVDPTVPFVKVMPECADLQRLKSRLKTSEAVIDSLVRRR